MASLFVCLCEELVFRIYLYRFLLFCLLRFAFSDGAWTWGVHLTEWEWMEMGYGWAMETGGALLQSTINSLMFEFCVLLPFFLISYVWDSFKPRKDLGLPYVF